MDFEGTTSATQFRTDSVRNALRLWFDDLSQPHSYGLTDLQRERLAEGCTDSDIDIDPTPLADLQSIWCSTVLARSGSLALLNIVETVNNE